MVYSSVILLIIVIDNITELFGRVVGEGEEKRLISRAHVYRSSSPKTLPFQATAGA